MLFYVVLKIFIGSIRSAEVSLINFSFVYVFILTFLGKSIGPIEKQLLENVAIQSCSCTRKIMSTVNMRNGLSLFTRGETILSKLDNSNSVILIPCLASDNTLLYLLKEGKAL